MTPWLDLNHRKNASALPGAQKARQVHQPLLHYALPHHVRTVRPCGCTRTCSSDLIHNPYANAIMQFADAMRHLFDNIRTSQVKHLLLLRCNAPQVHFFPSVYSCGMA